VEGGGKRGEKGEQARDERGKELEKGTQRLGKRQRFLRKLIVQGSIRVILKEKPENKKFPYRTEK
jgi:hypothetical protein